MLAQCNLRCTKNVCAMYITETVFKRDQITEQLVHIILHWTTLKKARPAVTLACPISLRRRRKEDLWSVGEKDELGNAYEGPVGSHVQHPVQGVAVSKRVQIHVTRFAFSANHQNLSLFHNLLFKIYYSANRIYLLLMSWAGGLLIAKPKESKQTPSWFVLKYNSLSLVKSWKNVKKTVH